MSKLHFRRKFILDIRMGALLVTVVLFASLLPAIGGTWFWQSGPTFNSPSNNGVVSLKPTFSWTAPWGVNKYRIDLAATNDPNFTNRLYTRNINGSTSTTFTVAKRDYLVRVAGLNGYGYQTTSWSPTLKITATDQIVDTNVPVAPVTSTTTTTTTTAPVTTTTTAPVTTTTIKPPTTLSGLNAFTTPVAGLQLSARSSDWTNRLVKYASVYGYDPRGWTTQNGQDASGWTTEFGFSKEPNNYGIAIYDAADATMRVKIRQKNPNNWAGHLNIDPDETVPWNPEWRPSYGKDGFLQIVDHTTGQKWMFWNVSWWNYQVADNNNLQCDPIFGGAGQNAAPIILWGHNYGGVGYDQNSMLCTAAGLTVEDPKGNIVDTRTFAGNFPGGSGAGWVVPAVTADEVASGKINHAFHFMANNTSMGRDCTAAQRLDPNALGNVCGDAIAPAAYYENTNKAPRPGMAITTEVPEGTRFSLNMTDAQIETWLTSKGYTGTRRASVKTIVVGLRDYGWFVGDSTGGGAGFTFGSAENPKDRVKWNNLGIGNVGDEKNLLSGLFSTNNIVAYEPPTNVCSDGSSSKWACWATSTRY